MTATKNAPRRFKLGRVERAFREKAAQANLTPKALLEKLVSEGVTQKQLSDLLGCTRQAIGVLAERHGVEFPGAKLDLDELVKKHTEFKSFAAFFRKHGQELTQQQIAAQLQTSLSTVKRRIYEITGK